MFGVDTSEFLVVAIVALLFIGPKELPRAMMTVGRWVGRVRGYARHFTSAVETAIREAELQEMERKWREENERILALHPADRTYPEPAGARAAPSTETETEPGLPLEMPGAVTEDSPPPKPLP